MFWRVQIGRLFERRYANGKHPWLLQARGKTPVQIIPVQTHLLSVKITNTACLNRLYESLEVIRSPAVDGFAAALLTLMAHSFKWI
jgi:hypothetical protein